MLVIVDSEDHPSLAKVDNEIKVPVVAIDVTEQKIIHPKKVNKSSINTVFKLLNSKKILKKRKIPVDNLFGLAQNTKLIVCDAFFIVCLRWANRNYFSKTL
jgi:hypothetical protein